MNKEKLLNWLALLILFAFAAAIIIPSEAAPGFFMGVAAPVLIVMAVFYSVLWAALRVWNLMNEEKGGETNEKVSSNGRGDVDAGSSVSASYRR